MFSLFRSRREETAVVVRNEHDFFLKLPRLQANRSVFETQGEGHGEIDLRLVQKIEAFLVPLLGGWEQSESWFHQLDYYGDGVRSLTFRRGVFPRTMLGPLQALLMGEHGAFTILCVVTDRFGSAQSVVTPERDDDYLALFARKVLVTKAFANELSIGA